MVRTLDVIKVRALWWLQVKEENVNISLSSLLYDFKSACVSSVKLKVSRCVGWVAAPERFFKFNVDGSTIGKPSLVGIRGVLRDWLGVVKGIFSINIGVENSNFAEL